MKTTIQLLTITASLLLLGAMITFSQTPQAKAVSKWPNPYWNMLGKYQGKGD
ncbi:MAG: hypothetical protein GY787_02445 [Alteromonadales bacterium]|nr:hypothetical protein [Alteromonadales bacterium]